MSKRVSVFGLGYVGSVTAACLASKGNSVIGVDLSPAKVEQLAAGRSPIVEPGVNELIEQAHNGQRLRATTDSVSAIMETDISFLCYRTPTLARAKPSLCHAEPA